MKFFADFHVHSKYSIATAKNLDLENLYIAGQLKGITVLGTGDVTHPAWFSEIKEKLVPAEQGLYKLKPDIAKAVDQHIPPICRNHLRFMLVTEISNIYKKKNKTRKNHNLVFFSSFESVEKFNQVLDKIGNIHSDGRPILGLDAKHLLEISLETSPDNFLVPAHIWTPWFSMLGSKSGFDTIEACFEELTPHIFAVETGLSSDPQMNWRVKNLDGLTLISNSDAHSPLKLGREANILDTALGYDAIKEAIKTGDPRHFCGTIEFFPEEGKYHFDGHRKCNYRSLPRETIQIDGRCPVCQKPMTLGVLYRVEELADRPQGQRPEKHHPFYHSIPLVNILSELLAVGPNSKKVQQSYHELLRKKGSEFTILHQLPLDKLNQTDIPLLGEAIKRIRDGQIHIDAGFDGQFGTIRLFTRRQREKLSAQKKLFGAASIATDPMRHQKRKAQSKIIAPKIQSLKRIDSNNSFVLNDSQSKVVHHPGGAIIVVAGPGTGKTLTLTHRIAQLIKNRHVRAANILGLTFTNQAAREMLGRLRRLLPNKKQLPLVTTFHSFCLGNIHVGSQNQTKTVIDDREQLEIIKDAQAMAKISGVDVPLRHEQLADAIRRIKQEQQADADKLDHLSSADRKAVNAVYQAYQQIVQILGLVDFEDLIGDVVRLLENDISVRTAVQKQYPYIFVDEYQDINTGQYRLLKKLAHAETEICVIGDPDQSIYGFRGSQLRYFNRFHEEYPDAECIQLHQNYRTTQIILNVAQQMIQKTPDRMPTQHLVAENQGTQKVCVLACKNEKHEAVT
ncbi:MAG: UvrD-helicase domain-containing protein, partial [Deltaproteobacteria bacterium]|nr:UvrD-helicase domain-containing protein [Deltaproteobacteria bacterium]